MAGLSGNQVVVDVVAASEKLRPSTVPEPELPTQPPVSLEVPHPHPTSVGTCPLGHRNAEGTRFCGSCGLKMDAMVLTSNVDLNAARPRPPENDQERLERDRQHLEAMRAAAQFEHVPETYVPTQGDGILIHFVTDGLTAFGRVWYKGQELEVGPSHPRWEEALRWITLSKWEQIERYGRQYFDQGPWPGRRSYRESVGAYEKLAGGRSTDGKLTGFFAGPTPEQLAAADEAERRRGRAVPVPTF